MTQLEIATDVLKKHRPKSNPNFSCMLVASVIAGMNGYGLGKIRVGAYYHRTKFDDDPYLSMRGGWGLEGFDLRSGRVYFSDSFVDDDGGFNGHTWIEPWSGYVLDPMHDNIGKSRAQYDKEGLLGLYIPRKDLENSVKGFWKSEMMKFIKIGKGLDFSN